MPGVAVGPAVGGVAEAARIGLRLRAPPRTADEGVAAEGANDGEAEDRSGDALLPMPLLPLLRCCCRC